ncbi:TlpA family protein disulfide reductase [Thalassolituus sp. LLYu03]|uniref:TlpA family protein disulfide reductase n=1 Tax=Thalassolituus sp. LLYu03 TaxID=3421656 RepID=UPI003D28CFE8
MQRVLMMLLGLILSWPVLAADIDFDQLKGKVVYVDFWASWCGPCRSSFPWMAAMQRKYAAQGLEIIAVNLDQQPELAQQFVNEFKPEFRLESDPEGQLAGQFGVDTMPTSFLIDRTGKARARHKGFHPDKTSDYEREIRALLGEH